MSRSVLLLLGLAFMTLGAAQVAVEGASTGPWWTVVGITHIAFGIALDRRDAGPTLDGGIPAEEG